jgi:hypothetical protein
MNWSTIDLNVIEKHRENIRNAINFAFANQTPFQVEFQFSFHKDQFFIFRGQPESNQHFLFGVLIDVTEHQRVYELISNKKLIADNAISAKSAYLASFSHETRNQLSGISHPIK